MPVDPVVFTWRAAIRASGRTRRTARCGPSMDESAILVVDEAGGAVIRAGRPLARKSVRNRRICEDGHAEGLWRMVALLCGLCLSALTLTGVIIWLQPRGIQRSSKFPGLSAEFGLAG